MVVRPSGVGLAGGVGCHLAAVAAVPGGGGGCHLAAVAAVTWLVVAGCDLGGGRGCDPAAVACRH
jgi:hypothetical protein